MHLHLGFLPHYIKPIMAIETSPSPASAMSPSDPRVNSLHIILTRLPSSELEEALCSCGISPVPELVEYVLPLCFSAPSSALLFFLWARRSTEHSNLAWNLMVEILGKNELFDDMWKLIKSMRDESSALSLKTFSCAFESYCSANRIDDAVNSFKVMDRYGLVQDVLAVNSLLTAMTHQIRGMIHASDFFDEIKEKIKPNNETFLILLQGWEKEANTVRAKRTFSEMATILGWRKDNVSAYDTFLITLIKGYDIEGAIKFLKLMNSNDCLPGFKFFKLAMDVLLKKKDFKNSKFVWETMVSQRNLVPTDEIYHSMILLSCENDNVDYAYKLLDGMPLNGIFPDSPTYEAIFDCLVRMKNPKEAEKFFLEMRKNEKIPSPSSCAFAIRMFFEEFDPIAAREVWKFAREEFRVSHLEDCVKEMILGLLNLERMRELRLHLEELVDYGIVLSRSTMDDLKSIFYKAGLGDFYERRFKHLRVRV